MCPCESRVAADASDRVWIRRHRETQWRSYALPPIAPCNYVLDIMEPPAPKQGALLGTSLRAVRTRGVVTIPEN